MGDRTKKKKKEAKSGRLTNTPKGVEVDNLLTLQRMCIFIYIHAVKLLTGPSLALLMVFNWSK